jgi:hypothetical protein
METRSMRSNCRSTVSIAHYTLSLLELNPEHHRQKLFIKATFRKLEYILLSTPSLHTLNLSASLDVGDQVSHPYKTRGKIKFPVS